VVVALGASLAQGQTRIQGAGASFPNPLYQKWVVEYGKIHPDVKIDYQSIGSGGGIKGITDKTVDFAGTDAPMSKKEREAAGAEIAHLPTVAGSVVAAFNLPDFKGDLKLSGPILADIYLGKIAKWNDAKIAALNGDLKLPDLAITPVYRTDGSGTNFVFTNYLTTQSETFLKEVGPGKQVKWPLGQGGKGSEGVTAAVQSTKGSIGYVEMNYAVENKLPFALLQNKDGKFVKASPDSVAAAGEGALKAMEKSLAVDLWNQSGEAAYPIAAFTYILVYQDLSYMKDQAKAKALVDFLWWATHDGQKMAADMQYAPLSPGVQKKVEQAIGSLMFDGKAIRPVEAGK
jgi:phosphate transport system substrate-binding protein